MASVKARDTGTLFCHSIHMYRKLGLVQSQGSCLISTEAGDPEPQADPNLCGCGLLVQASGGDPRGPCSECGLRLLHYESAGGGLVT